MQNGLWCHANKSVVYGIWYTKIRAVSLSKRRKNPMPTAIALTPSTTLLSQVLAAVDRWLLAYAEMTIRNGDIPRFDV